MAVDAAGVIGSGISAAASIWEGLQNRKAQEDANAANAEAQKNANLINLAQDQRNFSQHVAEWENANRQFERNFALQEEMARSGIRTKVADAIAAGLHPLYALGGSGATFSPVSVVGAGGSQTVSPSAARTAAVQHSGLARAGQDISRALQAGQTGEERFVTQATTALSLERAGLENELLRSQIARVRQQTNPPMPSEPDAFGQSTGTGGGARGRSSGRGDLLFLESSPNPDIGLADTSSGRKAVVPGQQVKNAIEDMGPYVWEHYIRNAILPRFGFNRAFAPGAGDDKYEIRYDPVMNEYWRAPREPKSGARRFREYFFGR